MTIKCGDISELVTVCAQLVREGVTFVAYTTDNTIELTGGY